eukprot:gene5327-7393_t
MIYKSFAPSSTSICGLFPDANLVHILAFIGGFVDAAGYVKITGVFTSSITGNLVVACVSMYHRYGVTCRTSVCAAFVIAGGLSSTIALRLKHVEKLNARQISITLFTHEIIGYVASIALGIIFNKQIDQDNKLTEWQTILVGSLLGAVMGFHNVSAKEAIGPTCPPTTVMTSTLINVAGNASNTVNFFLAKHHLFRLIPYNETPTTIEEKQNLSYHFDSKFQESYTKLMITIFPLIYFIIGALVGGAITYNISFWSLLIPLTIKLILIIFLKISDRMLIENQKHVPVLLSTNDEKEKDIKFDENDVDNDNNNSNHNNYNNNNHNNDNYETKNDDINKNNEDQIEMMEVKV